MAGHDVTEAAVQALIAINDGDRTAFFAALTPDATMSDDGTDRDLAEWADREIFSGHGHLAVVSADDGGRSLIAAYRNDTWVKCAPAGPSPSPTARSAASRPAKPYLCHIDALRRGTGLDRSVRNCLQNPCRPWRLSTV